MTMDVIARGNVAVVTGAASGIGLAAARHFAGAGMRVCLVDSAPQVGAAAAAIGADALGFQVDVSDRAAVERLAHEVGERAGPVSLLMNNAAIHGGADALGKPECVGTRDGGQLDGASFNGVQAFVPAMLAQRPARRSSSTPAPSRASRSRRATPPTMSARPA